jgi:hypothetical protein
MLKIAEAPLILPSGETLTETSECEDVQEATTNETENNSEEEDNNPNGRENTAGEYDSESDKEMFMDNDVMTNEVGAETNFLMGTSSRFGRVIRFNNRLLF